MRYKTILVQISSEKRAKEILDVAVMLAARNDAHLIGLFVVPDVRINPSIAVYVPATMLTSHEKYHREQADKIKTLFEQATKSEGLSAEWRTIQSGLPDIAPTIIKHGQMADLIILGQANEATDDSYISEVPSEVLMGCGRPVLLVPHSGSVASIGEHVLAGWNGRREAARAIYDALPFLQAAKKVQLLWVNPKKENAQATTLPGTEMAATLSRHGVIVETESSVDSDLAAGEDLLAIAAGKGSDLLVMGGYGHSRTREFILGGATRYVLEHMTIPVLISH